MAYETNRQICTDPNRRTKNLVRSIACWVVRQIGKYQKNQAFTTLLRDKDRVLDHVGLHRSDLVRKLEYDPREWDRMRAAAAYPNPYLWNLSAMNSDSTKSHR